jgi:hypothetical protein
MSKRPRFKTISREEFGILQQRNWLPVALAGAAIPSFLSGLPQERLLRVFGSGTYYDERIEQLGDEVVPYVVGGLDVFRHDSKDAERGFAVNKDHYLVIRDLTSDKRFLVTGPLTVQGDHWFEKLPEEHPEIEVVDLPKDEGDEGQFT